MTAVPVKWNKKAPEGAFLLSGAGVAALQWLRRCFLTTIHRGARNLTMLM
ncbi:hypothetical protein BTE28158_02913 [Burkholderia territorii]|nr:hypothetical protein BTE28158_02913 [Burkholderia territorii]